MKVILNILIEIAKLIIILFAVIGILFLTREE